MFCEKLDNTLNEPAVKHWQLKSAHEMKQNNPEKRGLTEPRGASTLNRSGTGKKRKTAGRIFNYPVDSGIREIAQIKYWKRSHIIKFPVAFVQPINLCEVGCVWGVVGGGGGGGRSLALDAVRITPWPATWRHGEKSREQTWKCCRPARWSTPEVSTPTTYTLSLVSSL